MHVPDGFIDAPTSLACGAVAVVGLGACLRGARRELDDRTAPLAGLVASFVFAAQMINFPVAAGTSGHLLGATLAAVLVGPWTGATCVAVVLLIQALGFADGGLTAYGVNVVLLALVGTLVGYVGFRAVRALLPWSRRGVTVAAGVGALLSVPGAALAFVGIYLVGGTVSIPLGTLLAAMTGVHVLIGVGEALITAATVASVLAVRPDLVHGARHLHVPLELRGHDLTRS